MGIWLEYVGSRRWGTSAGADPEALCLMRRGIASVVVGSGRLGVVVVGGRKWERSQGNVICSSLEAG